MIPLPFKYTARTDVTTPMLAYLESKYSKDEARRHADAVQSFQSQRNDIAALQTANEGARAALARYYHVCDSGRDKFPVSETNVKIPFLWTDTLRPDPKRSVSQYSWAYEQASVLFNLAAVESQLAAAVPRDTPEGIEKAAKQFGLAAGILTHLRDHIASHLLGSLPCDMTREGLTLLIALQLGQGQACYYEMAQLRGMKPETTARIAAQAADWYRAAAKALPETVMRDVDAAFPWSTFFRYHAASFDAASFWAMAMKMRAEAETKGEGYGVEIAWLTVARNAAATAIAFVRDNRAAEGVGMTTSHTELLLHKITERLEEAERDNNRIYMNLIPAPKDLPTIPRAELAKPAPMPDLSSFKGADMFASIVPVEVSAAMMGLNDRLAVLVAAAKERGVTATEAAKAALASMGLPGYLDAADGGPATGMPEALWGRIRKTQIEGGLGELELMFTSNQAAARQAASTLAQTARVLDDEAVADSTCRRTYGERWTAIASDLIAAEVRSEVAKLTKLTEVAAASDVQVRDKIDAYRGRIANLGRSKAELDAALPAPPTTIAGGTEGAALRQQLKTALATLQAALDGRAGAASGIKDKFDHAAAVSAFLAAPVADHGAITERLVNGSWASKAAFEDNLATQERVLDMVRVLHARYSEVRSRDDRLRARESALQELNDAVDRFEELRSNVKEGAAFYADLNARAEQLLVTARDMAAARALQQRELILNIRAAAESGAAVAASGSAPVPAYPVAALQRIPSITDGGVGVRPTASTTLPVATAVPVPVPPADAYGGGASVNPFDAFCHPSAAPVVPSTPGFAPTAGYGRPAPTVGGASSAASYPVAPAVGHASTSHQVQQLTNMGFDRVAAERALAANGGDIGRAVAALLDGGSGV